MEDEEILIWRDDFADEVVVKQGANRQSFSPEQWRFICQCVEKDLSSRLDDALRMVRMLKDEVEKRENATGSDLRGVSD